MQQDHRAAAEGVQRAVRVRALRQGCASCSGGGRHRAPLTTACAAGLLMRERGKIQDSLQLFQAATALNPHNVANLKQVGRSLCVGPPEASRTSRAPVDRDAAARELTGPPPARQLPAREAQSRAGRVRGGGAHRRRGLGNLAQQGPVLHVHEAVPAGHRRVPERQLHPAPRRDVHAAGERA